MLPNDPRERRRLAKQAAEQALGTSQASTGSRKAEAESTPAAEPTTEVVAATEGIW